MRCFPRLSNVLVLFSSLFRLTFSKRQISIRIRHSFALSLSLLLSTRAIVRARDVHGGRIFTPRLWEMVRPRRFGRRRPNFRSRSHSILHEIRCVGKKGSHRVLGNRGRTQEWIPNFKRIHRRHGRRVAETSRRERNYERTRSVVEKRRVERVADAGFEEWREFRGIEC